MTVRPCCICGQEREGTIVLGGEFACWKCLDQMKRLDVRTQGKRIREALKELDRLDKQPPKGKE